MGEWLEKALEFWKGNAEVSVSPLGFLAMMNSPPKCRMTVLIRREDESWVCFYQYSSIFKYYYFYFLRLKTHFRAFAVKCRRKKSLKPERVPSSPVNNHPNFARRRDPFYYLNRPNFTRTVPLLDRMKNDWNGIEGTSQPRWFRKIGGRFSVSATTRIRACLVGLRLFQKQLRLRLLK